MARLNVGIEPSDITLFMRLLFGADIGTDVEGMFQINSVSAHKSGHPLPTKRMDELWHFQREKLTAAGLASDPVAIIEFVKGSETPLSFPLHIPQPAFRAAREMPPFTKVSALTGVKTEIPISAMGCIE